MGSSSTRLGIRLAALVLASAFTLTVFACSPSSDSCQGPACEEDAAADGGDGSQQDAGDAEPTPDGDTDGGAGKDADADGGSQSQPALVLVDTEAPGANCTNGGRAFKTGLDLNDDGVLQSTEVTQTAYVCSPTTGKALFGDYTIANSIDVDLLAGYSKITGRLTITAPSLPNVTLPDLVEIGGDFVIDTSTGLTAVSMPALTLSQRLVVSHNDALTSLSLPKLVYAGTAFELNDNALLATVTVPKLITSDEITMIGNPKLTSPPLTGMIGSVKSLLLSQNGFTTLSGLEGIVRVRMLDITQHQLLTDLTGLSNVRGSLDGLNISSNPVLTTLSGLGGIRRLEQPATISTVSNNAKLSSTAALSGLSAVDGTLYVADNPALATVSFPALATAKVILVEETTGAPTPVVTTIDLPNLTSVTSNIQVHNCKALTALQAPKLATVTGVIEVQGDTALTTLSFPALTSGGLRLANDGALATLSVPKLATAPSIEISVPALSTLDLPVLTTAGLIDLTGAAIATVHAPVLTTVSGALKLDGMASLSMLQTPMLASSGSVLVRNTPLTSLGGLAALQTISTSLEVSSNAALTALGMTALKTVSGDFSITNNVALDTCLAKAVRAQLTTTPTTSTIQGNKNPAAVCP